MSTGSLTTGAHSLILSSFNPNVPPLGDPNSWYYPSQGYSSDEDEDDSLLQNSNWGQKTTKGARWMRRGKMTAWGPGMDEWEVSTHN